MNWQLEQSNWEKLGNFEDSLISFNSALKTDNSHVISLAQKLKVERQICLWSSHESIQKWHKSGQISFMKIQPRDLAYLIDDPVIDLKVARELFQREFKRIERKIDQKKNDKIHICYFSSDFRNHPVSPQAPTLLLVPPPLLIQRLDSLLLL